MHRIPATLNRMKCVSNVLLSQGSRFARPLSTSAFRFSEETSKKEDHNVEALFNAEPNTRFDQTRRRQRQSVCLNRIELMGGVADQPIERTSRGGNSYLSFNMFTNVEYRKPDGSFDENVELHNVIVFGTQLGYVRRNIQRGSRVFVTGRLHYSNGPTVGGQVSRSADVVADLVQVIAKPVPREDRRAQSGEQDDQ